MKPIYIFVLICSSILLSCLCGLTTATENKEQQPDPELRAKTFYELLGVERDAEVKVIKRNFRRISVKIHPDKSRTVAERKIRAANYPLYVLASETLSDTIKRRSYDRLLDFGRAPQSITDYDIENAWDKERQMWRDEIGWAPLEDWHSLLLITIITAAVFGYPIYLHMEEKKRKKEKKESTSTQKAEMLNLVKSKIKAEKPGKLAAKAAAETAEREKASRKETVTIGQTTGSESNEDKPSPSLRMSRNEALSLFFLFLKALDTFQEQNKCLIPSGLTNTSLDELTCNIVMYQGLAKEQPDPANLFIDNLDILMFCNGVSDKKLLVLLDTFAKNLLSLRKDHNQAKITSALDDYILQLRPLSKGLDLKAMYFTTSKNIPFIAKRDELALEVGRSISAVEFRKCASALLLNLIEWGKRSGQRTLSREYLDPVEFMLNCKKNLKP